MSGFKIKTMRTQKKSRARGPIIGYFVHERWSIGETEVWYENGEIPPSPDGTELSYESTRKIVEIVSELFELHAKHFRDHDHLYTTTVMEHDNGDLLKLLSS